MNKKGKAAEGYSSQQSKAYHDGVAMEGKCHDIFMNLFRRYAKGATRVVDLGCGDFFLAEQMLAAAPLADIIGVDASKDMLAKVSAKNSRLSLRQQALPDAPILGGRSRVDVITSMYFLQVLSNEDLQKTFARCYKALRDGGIMILVIKHPLQQFLQKLQDQGEEADYFASESVTLPIFDGALPVTEPSHTMQDYVGAVLGAGFMIREFAEHSEFPASKRFTSDHPTFFTLVLEK